MIFLFIYFCGCLAAVSHTLHTDGYSLPGSVEPKTFERIVFGVEDA